MATLKKPVRSHPYRFRERLADVRIALPLDVVLDGPRPGQADPAADAVWRQLRAKIGRLCMGHAEHDPRRLFALQDPVKLARWTRRRREWLATELASDSRIETA